MLEVGCGVGNAVIPLIEINPLLKVYAIDFAKSAIDTLLKHKYCQGNDPPIYAFQADIVKDNLDNIQEESLDIILCLFVLSAISPSDHAQVIYKLSRLLKPGGKLLIRDYGRFDEAQLRFKKGGKLDDNFYVRCDGTCSYFFELQELVKICENTNNLIEEEAKYILRQFANRQKRQKRTRVWVHCKFIKKTN
jgi:methyltransferase-like protein 6